jgi:hypothetical protein
MSEHDDNKIKKEVKKNPTSQNLQGGAIIQSIIHCPPPFVVHRPSSSRCVVDVGVLEVLV